MRKPKASINIKPGGRTIRSHSNDIPQQWKFIAMKLPHDEEGDNFLISERRRLREIHHRLQREGKSVIDPYLLVSYRKKAFKLPDELSTLWKLAYVTLMHMALNVCNEYYVTEQQKVEKRSTPHPRSKAKPARDKPTIYSHRRRIR